MAKTTPVRWWRDDATRYASRGAEPKRRPDPDWMVALLGLHDPEMARTIMPMLEVLPTEIAPLEFERLEPQPEPAWLRLQLERAFANGWRPAQPGDIKIDLGMENLPSARWRDVI